MKRTEKVGTTTDLRTARAWSRGHKDQRKNTRIISSHVVCNGKNSQAFERKEDATHYAARSGIPKSQVISSYSVIAKDKKPVSSKQLNALARGREIRAQNVAKEKGVSRRPRRPMTYDDPAPEPKEEVRVFRRRRRRDD